MEILKQATPSQIKKASDALIAAGFALNPTETSTIVQAMVVNTKRLCSQIDIAGDEDLAHEETTEELIEAKPETIQ